MMLETRPLLTLSAPLAAALVLAFQPAMADDPAADETSGASAPGVSANLYFTDENGNRRTAIQGKYNVYYMYIYYPEEFYPEYDEMTNKIIESFRIKEIPSEEIDVPVEKKNGPKQKQNI
jgi:hypothetical protein